MVVHVPSNLDVHARARKLPPHLEPPAKVLLQLAPLELAKVAILELQLDFELAPSERLLAGHGRTSILPDGNAVVVAPLRRRTTGPTSAASDSHWDSGDRNLGGRCGRAREGDGQHTL